MFGRKEIAGNYYLESVYSSQSLVMPCWNEYTINVIVLIDRKEWIKFWGKNDGTGRIGMGGVARGQ